MQPLKKTAFYFVAHADDWQLFMAPDISHDIADKDCKVVIIHITAGDAGLDERYWRAREKAAIDSLLFRISVDGYLHQSGSDVIVGNNKKAGLFIANNCYCYFLRLPDGAYNGNGFQKYNYQSLEKFRTGMVSQLCTVDDQCVYSDYQELADTIDAIITRETETIAGNSLPGVCLNFPEPDSELNPYDHNDHFNTTMLLKSTTAYSRYAKRAFLSYHIKNSNDFLSNDELFWKIGMFCTYHQSLFKEYGHSTILEDDSFIPWCFRNSSSRKL